jgi:hypothetical protein
MIKDKALKLVNELIAENKALKSALAQPEQEPDHGDELTIAYMSGVHRGKELAAQPAQRPWVGLTDKEIQECLQGLPTQTIDVYAKRIEAKLKEKNT